MVIPSCAFCAIDRAVSGRLAGMRKLHSSLKDLISAFFDPLVVVAMMTTLGLIIGILAFASTPPRIIGWKIIIVCCAIGLLGLVAILLQMRRILSGKYIRERLAELHKEGREVTIAVGMRIAGSVEPFSEWRTRVMVFLGKHLDNSYVIRFDTANTGGVEVLLDFIKELK